ncbi:hypothetical protein CR513_36397, partial [Mucuna pruriens]
MESDHSQLPNTLCRCNHRQPKGKGVTMLFDTFSPLYHDKVVSSASNPTNLVTMGEIMELALEAGIPPKQTSTWVSLRSSCQRKRRAKSMPCQGSLASHKGKEPPLIQFNSMSNPRQRRPTLACHQRRTSQHRSSHHSRAQEGPRTPQDLDKTAPSIAGAKVPENSSSQTPGSFVTEKARSQRPV